MLQEIPCFAMVVYSKKQLREAAARKKYGRNCSIAGSVLAGWSAKKVAKEYQLSYSWAKVLVRRIKNGDTGERRAGSGRPRKTTERQDRHIVREATRERASLEDCPRAHDVAEELTERGTQISERTVRRRLREKGFKKCVKTKKPFVNSRNRAIRLKFARKYVNWTVEQWKQVLWTDESPYFIRCMIRQYCWRRPDQKWESRCMQGTVKHQKKINVWGAFAWNGVGRLHRIIGTMDKHMYRQILIRQMRPSGRDLIGDGFILAQDNDPKHTSKVCQNYLSNQNIQVLEWPAQSPDLNPIENVWAELNRRLRKRKCNSEEELFELLTKTWNELDAAYLQKLIESMPRRCAAVIKSKGFPIDY